MFPLLLLPLSILAIRAPYPLLTERTSSSILVQYEDFYSASGGANIAYEVDFKSLFNSQW